MKKTHAIGVDIGGTSLRVALVSPEGKISKKIKKPSTGDIMSTLREAIGSLADKNVAGVGIGVAGLVDRTEKKVVFSPNIHTLNGQGFSDIVPGLPVMIENDANAAALGERWMGAGKDYENFVLLTLGTGVGGGIVCNGRLLGVASEIGHMSIESSGPKCPCGNNGCLELYASALAIVGEATKALEQGKHSLLKECCKGNIYKITPEDVYRIALDGDSLAREILRNAGRYLGVGIANIVNIMSPDAVILTGGLTGAWDIFIDDAVQEASKRSLKGLFDRVRIIPSALGTEDAGILGSAGLILHGNKDI